jgi:primary-amine oxidase
LTNNRKSQGLRHRTLSLIGFLLFAHVVVAETTIGGDAAPVYPLDSLSKQEILETVDVLRTAGKTREDSRYSLIRLQEPPKEDVLGFTLGSPLHRQSFVVVYERAANQTFEAVIDLAKRSLISWKNIPGVQPSFLEEDAEILQKAVRADPRFAEIMQRHGVTDLASVEIGDWPGGYYGDPTDNGVRYRRADFSYHDPKTLADRKIENVSADVDLNKGKVIRWIEGDVVPIPTVSAGMAGVPPLPTRPAPKPLVANEPQGPSFEIHDHEVRWQNWRFRFGFNSREGLILYTVGYQDHGQVRSILYRATCSEMVVPYGDPGLNWYYKNAFDSGEDSFGRYASPLEAGTDVPEYAEAFNVVLPSEKGDWFEIPRAMALYERDGGMLWKHWDQAHSRNESRRARDLVLAWIATVGNYDYGFNWIFHQDGSLEMEVQLTGYMETKGSPLETVAGDEGDARYGHLLAPNLVAVNHQHFFSFRLDMDVDGTANSVLEDNTSAAAPGANNRYSNAFTATETLFHNETEAERQINMETNRCWTVINSAKKNAAGYPVGYTLLPGENASPYAASDSWVRKRSSFTNASFWATPYDPDQMHAAGFYVNQSRGKEGLKRWVEAQRSIENKDVVVWYTMGITHIPRPEEYPMMSVHKAGFMLVPNCFFDENPAIGLP